MVTRTLRAKARKGFARIHSKPKLHPLCYADQTSYLLVDYAADLPYSIKQESPPLASNSFNGVFELFSSFVVSGKMRRDDEEH